MVAGKVGNAITCSIEVRILLEVMEHHQVPIVTIAWLNESDETQKTATSTQ